MAAYTTAAASVQTLANTFINDETAGVAVSINNPDKATALAALIPSAVTINNMSLSYQSSLSSEIAHAMQSQDATSLMMRAMQTSAQNDGFTTAGAFYMTMAQTSYAMSSITKNVSPSISKTAEAPLPSDSIWGKAYTLINVAEKSSGTNPSGSGESVSSEDAAWKQIMSKLDKGFLGNHSGQGLVDRFITVADGKPVMIRLKDLADYMVLGSSVLITAVAGVLGFFNEPIVAKLASLTPVECINNAVLIKHCRGAEVHHGALNAWQAGMQMAKNRRNNIQMQIKLDGFQSRQRGFGY